MADRIYPSAKPNTNPNPPQSLNPTNPNQPNFPPTKSQLYNRPTYRPPPPAKLRRTRRRCCRPLCCWIFLILISLILLVALAGGIFYILFHPQNPKFSLSSLQLSSLNISSNQVKSKLNLAIVARNPNRKIAILYDPISIIVRSDGVDVGEGSFPAFVQGKKNTTVLRVDPIVAVNLKKNNVVLEIDLETKAGVKVGGLKTKKMGIRVRCEGVQIEVPKGKKKMPPLMKDVSCRVKLRIKIWKWTV